MLTRPWTIQLTVRRNNYSFAYEIDKNQFSEQMRRKFLIHSINHMIFVCFKEVLN